MAGRFNSHKHKKLNRYTASTSAKRMSFSPYLIILISALAAVIVALLLGTFLGKMADSAPKPEDNAKEDKNPEPPSLLDAKQIKGAFVTLEGILDSTAQNVRAQIPSDSEAVSLILFDKNGDPYYRSEICEAFEKKCGELTLSRVFEGITVGERMLYSSVVFPTLALNNADAPKQAVMNAYEASLIEELARAGACDVILTPFSFGDEDYGIDNSFVAKLETYVVLVRALCPSIRIGLAMPIEYASENDHAMLLEELSKRVDFIALDLTERTDIESFSDAISDASLNILRRDIRLLISDIGEEETKTLTDLLDKYSMTNYQIVNKK